MTKRTFEISNDIHSITLRIDTDRMHPKALGDGGTVSWFIDDLEDYPECNRDELKMYALLAAEQLLDYLDKGYDTGWAEEQLSKTEGWAEYHGVSIVGYKLHSKDLDSYQIEEY